MPARRRSGILQLVAANDDRRTASELDWQWHPPGGRWSPAADRPASARAARSNRFARFARGWLPEVVGAALALLTIAAAPFVVRTAHEVAIQMRSAEASAYWQPAHPGGLLDVTLMPSPDGQPATPVVNQVDPFGASAGILQTGDVITAIDGHPTASIQAVDNALSTLPSGTLVHLTVRRGTATRSVEVRLGPGLPPRR